VDSEGLLIARPLPPGKRNLLILSGLVTLVISVGGLLAFMVNEEEVKAALASLPFGPEDAGAGVLPLLGVPVVLLFLLFNRYASRYGSCLLVPGGLEVRPLWGPSERGGMIEVEWMHVARVEEREDTVCLELEGGLQVHVPTDDPGEIRLLFQLHQEALAGPRPVHVKLRPALRVILAGFLRALWLLAFGLLNLGLTFKGIGRFAPTLASESPAYLELVALLIFLPLLTWFMRAKLPRMLGTEHQVTVGDASVVPAGVRLGAHYFEFSGLRVFQERGYLALESASGQRYVAWVGRALPELLAAMEPHLEEPSGERPEWLVTERAPAYARATLFMTSLVLLQWWLFVL
jgi:hypothetical protein